MRYRLRTLLIVLAVGPMVLALCWWKYAAWKAEQAQQKALEAEKARKAELIETTWRELLFDPPGPPAAMIQDWRDPAATPNGFTPALDRSEDP
jgi:hypothetical protein